MKGMEYTDLTGADPELILELINDPRVLMQQKMDGTRALIDLSTGEVTQRNGNPLKHTAATQWLPAILEEFTRTGLIPFPKGTVLDGELMTETGEYHVFDMIDPEYTGELLHTRITRLAQLHRVMIYHPGRTGQVQFVRSAMTAADKHRLIEACRDTEGVVAKRLDAPYEPGVRVKHVMKLKNVHTADFVVVSTSESPLSAALGVHDESGELVTISRASLIGKGPIEAGDVVEANYLYFTGTGIVQPRIMRRREDKPPEECTFAQFSPYSREAV